MNRLSRRELFAIGAAASVGSLSVSGKGAWATPAWSDTLQAGPFSCRATFPLKEYAAPINELPELERELIRVLAVRPPRRPIEVYLLGDRLEHRVFLKENFPTVPYRRALFVKKSGQARVYAYRQPELAVDLRHECTHALLHSDLELVPLWMDEGIAEYFEAAPSERAFNHPHFRSLKWHMRLGMFRTIESLEKKHDLAEMNGNDYRFAWAWTHFMLHGPEVVYDQLIAFLRDVRRGSPPGLFSARLAQAVPNAPDLMVQHFKHWGHASATQTHTTTAVGMG